MKVLSKSGIKLFLVSFIIISLFISVSFVDAYVSVKSSLRRTSSGGITGVRSYVKSSPNALKYDNYSWKPSQGLYNKSYFTPTRNYSSDWYTPSYITDPNYYFGKSIYESRSYRSYDLPSYRYSPILRWSW